MYKLGFIDDDKNLVQDYKKRLRRKEIKLLLVEDCITKSDVLNWILKNQITCMLVDYKLKPVYDFNGTELVAYLNSELPDLPCIILTNYCNQGIDENLVIKNLFMERERLDKDFDSPAFEEMISIFKQAVEVFNNRIKHHIKEYEELKIKKDQGDISTEEEERFLELFKLLRSYNEVDDIPSELLKSNTTKKLEDILNSLDKLLDSKK